MDRAPSLSLVCLILTTLFQACAGGPSPRNEDPVDDTALKSDIQALDSGDAEKREKARKNILLLGPVVCRDLGREVVGRVEDADAGPGLVCLLRLLGALGGSGAGRPLRAAALKRPLETGIRVEAVRALGMCDAPEGPATLVECSRKGEPLPLRVAAVASLGKYVASAEAREALRGHLALGPAVLREKSGRALLAWGKAELREDFKARLLDAHPGVRLVAVSYFRQHPHSSAEPLLQALASTDPDVRIAAAAGAALGALERD